MKSKFKVRKILKKEYIVIFLMFIMNMGFFMIIPYLTIHLTNSVGLAGTIVGLILAFRLISQQGLTFFGGVLADKIGLRINIILGSALRSIGFLLFGLSTSTFLLFLAAIFSGLGGALFTPAIRAALIKDISSEIERNKIFSSLNISDNLALAIGPLIGVALLKVDFLLLSIVSSSIYIVIGLLLYALLRNKTVNGKAIQNRVKTIDLLVVVIRDRNFVTLVVSTIGFFFTVQQIYVLIPLILDFLDSTEVIAYIYIIISGSVILLQVPIDKFLNMLRISNSIRILIGYLMLILFTIPVTITLSIFSLLLFVFGIAMSLIIISPAYNTLVSNLATKNTLASFFGFSTLAAAVGGALGNFSGGYLIDLSIRFDSLSIPWFTIIVFNLIFVLFYIFVVLKGKSQNSKLEDKVKEIS
ncbi:MFS transporter [Aquibacillus sp. 3ASR75-11]|uniref:MFS transporter n=1 Tax=Terrihalobacillus insolitus TaxID=2950438 RepID=A0A9X3WV97_9BACI|nr:MFS transporter [Terrihalobacillus insolitus]MDC3412995.1 MFS transporter [Terrihalobacillus insolitus]MDC3426300.1 MFS transporter [Terrihalobacillus insolitus]